MKGLILLQAYTQGNYKQRCESRMGIAQPLTDKKIPTSGLKFILDEKQKLKDLVSVLWGF